MSFILDALRKSEHDRQMSAGLSVGLLYPVEIKRKRNLWPILALLILAVFVTFALAWWMWSPSILTPPTITKASKEINKPPVSPQPQTISQETFLAPEIIPEKILPEPKALAKPKKLVPEYAHKKIPLPHPDARQKPPTQTDSLAGASAVINNAAASVDPLKNLPPLEISGYIHNEQSGNLAIINNQLVHEGEEILPGLILVKILENSAIFSYRGYVFTR